MYCRVIIILKLPLDPFGYTLYSESKKKVLYSVFNVYLYVIDPALYRLNHRTYRTYQIHTKHAPQIILKNICLINPNSKNPLQKIALTY